MHPSRFQYAIYMLRIQAVSCKMTSKKSNFYSSMHKVIFFSSICEINKYICKVRVSFAMISSGKRASTRVERKKVNRWDILCINKRHAYCYVRFPTLEVNAVAATRKSEWCWTANFQGFPAHYTVLEPVSLCLQLVVRFKWSTWTANIIKFI